MSYLYGEPKYQFAITTGTMTISSPRQAMLMERIMVEAMAKYAGKPEETLLALWHRQAAGMRSRAKRDGWIGWEDEYPVEHVGRAALEKEE